MKAESAGFIAAAREVIIDGHRALLVMRIGRPDQCQSHCQ